MSPDLKKLQGVWNVTSLEMDGVPAGSEGASITVNGSRFVSQGMGAEYGGTVELRDKEKPKRITLHFEDGPEKGNANHGIYEIRGDSWRICLATGGGAAPKLFSTSPGSGHALETLQRAAKAPGVPASVTFAGPHEPVAELQGEWAMVTCLRGGVALPAPGVTFGRRKISGVETVLTFGPETHMKGLYCADVEGVVMHNTAGPSKGKSQYGIYELHGNRLKTCFGPPGGARPSDYTSTKENGNTLTEWERVL